MTAPIPHGSEKVVNILIFRPEVSDEVSWIPWKRDTLRGDQFFRRGVASTRVFPGKVVHRVGHWLTQYSVGFQKTIQATELTLQ